MGGFDAARLSNRAQDFNVSDNIVLIVVLPFAVLRYYSRLLASFFDMYAS